MSSKLPPAPPPLLGAGLRAPGGVRAGVSSARVKERCRCGGSAVRSPPAPSGEKSCVLRGGRDETCSISTEGGTRRVHSVREKGGGGGAHQSDAASSIPERSGEARSGGGSEVTSPGATADSAGEGRCDAAPSGPPH